MITTRLINNVLVFRNQIKLCNRLYFVRSLKTKLDHNHNCIVSTFGSKDSGKTTLTEALKRISAEEFKFQLTKDIDSGAGNAVFSKYYVDDTQVVHVDVDSTPFKNLLTSSYGADIGLVVVDVSKGLDYQTKEHIIFLNLHGIEHFIVYLNKSDLTSDDDLKELVTDELKSFFNKFNLKLDDKSIVNGSALNVVKQTNQSQIDADRQSIIDVLKLIEIKTKSIDRNEQINKPALFSIKRSHTKMNKGTEVTGSIRQGMIKKGEIVNICGYDRLFKTKVQEIESFGEQLNCIKPGVSGALLLKSIKREDIQRGMIITRPDDLKKYEITDQFKGRIYCFNKDEQMNPYSLKDDDTLNIFARTLNARSIIKVENDKRELNQGEEGTVLFKLLKTMPLNEGMKFILRNANTVAIGEITKLLPSYEIEFLNKAKRN